MFFEFKGFEDLSVFEGHDDGGYEGENHGEAAEEDHPEADVLHCYPGVVVAGVVLLAGDLAVLELAVHAHGEEEQDRDLGSQSEGGKDPVVKSFPSDAVNGVDGKASLDGGGEADLPEGKDLKTGVQRLEGDQSQQEEALVEGGCLGVEAMEEGHLVSKKLIVE